jgi:hypothetical protein
MKITNSNNVANNRTINNFWAKNQINNVYNIIKEDTTTHKKDMFRFKKEACTNENNMVWLN